MPEFNIEKNANILCISGTNFKFIWSIDKGVLSQIKFHDGIKWNDALSQEAYPCSLPASNLVCFNIYDEKDDFVRITTQHKSEDWIIDAEYEVYIRGYIICNFSIEALRNHAKLDELKVGISLDKDAVFSNWYNIKNNFDSSTWTYDRAISVDFSTDGRKVTNSIDFILESVAVGTEGRTCKKVCEDYEKSKFLGWQLGNAAYFKKRFKYSNRWCVTVSGINSAPNKVRAQRIYHWYGFWPTYPSQDILEEMAEYGCSLLALHMQVFKYIDGAIAIDEIELIRTINTAHKLGMKVIFYCQPYLISINSPTYNEFNDCLNDGGLMRWHSLKDTQIVYYEPNSDCDNDELCLRCEKAFEYIKSRVINCYEKYCFDGLYIDFGWPEQAICNDTSHGHERGLYNFYDYLRMLREWRKAIGPDAIMIGHGGGLLVSSDFIEGFDACLTGEAQKDIEPQVIGQQFGLSPTLWAMHRKKEKVFRSKDTIAWLIREGLTPHVGVGIMGTSVLASLDPAYNIPLIALWQMWRAFPVHKAAFYNYLTEKVVSLDNNEVTYSLFVTEEKQIMLLLCNIGGKFSESMPAVGVNINIDTKKLKIPEKMKCWRMKGNTYETFRIAQIDDILNGIINVPELGISEFIGFILAVEKPPDEMINLVNHLDGRAERLYEIQKRKMTRLLEYDKLIDSFAKLPIANNKKSYEECMKGRVTE